jgi:sugar phosphate isomerase/epimerase
MVKDVGSPALAIHLDTFHMNIEETRLPLFVELVKCRARMLAASRNPGATILIEGLPVFKRIGYKRMLDRILPDVL